MRLAAGVVNLQTRVRDVVKPFKRILLKAATQQTRNPIGGVRW
jgi:hypothetical protein